MKYSKYEYSFSKIPRALQEFLGLSNDDQCQWNITVDENASSEITFKSRIRFGQVVAIKYEPVLEEGSGSGEDFFEVTSSRSRKRKTRIESSKESY